MTKGLVYISYGLGGDGIETWSNGLRLLVQRCKTAGYDTRQSPYVWNQYQEIAADIQQQSTVIPIAVGGASLGSNAAPEVASLVRRRVNYLFGFQDSIWGMHVGVPHSVDFADNVYNPSWWQTFGFGYGKWVAAPGNVVTKIRNIPIYAAHPDDWGLAQDIVFSRIHLLLGA
jgi:hypothetical protein